MSARCDARVPAAVLGATGLVGQHLVRLLVDHPWLRPGELVGSGRNAGRAYGEAVDWMIGDRVPDEVRHRLLLDPAAVVDALSSPVVLSALPASAAAELEPLLAGRGHLVCTNASAQRMRADVPLVVPEVNAGSLDVTARQPWWDAGGALVANPNCVVTGVALALAPIHRRWGVAGITMTTLQALSGAGARGPRAFSALGNVVPWIDGEEEKIPGELAKVLGGEMDVAVAVNRVPVVDGHTAQLFLRLHERARPARVARALEEFRPEGAVARLPTIPRRPLVVRPEPDRPQPRLDAGAGGGMAVSVGRIRESAPYDLALTVVSSNTVRGAAGACLANAELCLARGLVPAAGPGPDLSRRRPAPECCGAAP